MNGLVEKNKAHICTQSPLGTRLVKICLKKQNRTFSEDEFLVHFETCRSARMLWDDYILKHKDLSESVRSTLFRT